MICLRVPKIVGHLAKPLTGGNHYEASREALVFDGASFRVVHYGDRRDRAS